MSLTEKKIMPKVIIIGCPGSGKTTFAERLVTIQWDVFREGFRRKIPSLTGKNPITEGDLGWIFACNGEGTEQLHLIYLVKKF